MNTSRRLFFGSALRVVQFALQLAVVFFMTPFILHSLGVAMYGSWILITACVGYTALMDLGLSTGVARYISRAAGQGNDAEVNRVINTSLRLFSLVGLVVFFATLIGAGLCFFAVNKTDEARALALTVLFLGTRMALKFPTRTFDGVLTSHLRYDLQVIATLTSFLSAYALIFLLLRGGHGIAAMAAAMLGCSLVEYALIFFFARRSYPQMRLAGGATDGAMRRTLFDYGWKTVVWQFANTLRFKVDAPVIAAFLGRGLIAPYNIGAQLNTYFYEFVTTFIGNLSPVFSRYEGKGDYVAIREKFLMMTRIATVISIFGGASIIFYSHDFILRWMGAGFVGQLPHQFSYVVATILAAGYTLTLMQTPSSSLLFGISKHHYGAFMCLGEGLLNLVLSLALVKPLGIYGVALGTTIGLVVNQVFVYPVVACRSIQLPRAIFYRDIGWVAVKTGGLLAFYFWAVKSSLRPDYLTLTVLGAVQTLLFVPLCYFLVLHAPEKKILNSLVTQGMERYLHRTKSR